MNGLSLIQQRYPDMSPVEKRIADCILSEPSEAVSMSIGRLAAAAGVSEGSVVNFANALGFGGFSRMKINLAQNLQTFSVEEGVRDDDSAREIMRKLIRRVSASFESTCGAIGENIEAAAEALMSADRIVVVGFAYSQHVGSDLAFRLMRVGLPVQFYPDPLVAAIANTHLTERSVIVAVSGSGRTREVIACARTAREAGARLICLTNHAESPLARMSDIVLAAVSMEAITTHEPASARLTQLLICDTLTQYILNRLDGRAIVSLNEVLRNYEERCGSPINESVQE